MEDREAQMRDLEAQVEVLRLALKAVQSECSEQTAKGEALQARLLELARSVQANGSRTLGNENEQSAPDPETKKSGTDLHRGAHFAQVKAFVIASCRR